MQSWTKTTLTLAALFLAPASLMAKSNIANLARQCNSEGKQKACSELARIAVEDKNYTVRREAVENLADQAVLAKIALADTNIEVQNAAVSRLTDQTLLARVAVEGNVASLRSAALQKITDSSLRAKVAAEDDKRSQVRAVVLKYLAENATSLPGWTLAGADTTIGKEIINFEQGRATLTAQVVFTGGSGAGIHFSNGATAYFGATIGSTPETGIPMYGVIVYHVTGATYMMMPQEFSLSLEKGAWTITAMSPPKLTSPPFTPL